MSDSERPQREIAQDLIDAFIRLARADFSVRLERNFKRDTEDTLAFFVNLIAEELERLMSERERQRKALEQNVNDLSELFLRLAAGDFEVRARRTGSGDPFDVLAYLFNNTAAEVGDAFEELDRQRKVLETTLESMLDGVLLLSRTGVIQRANAAMATLLGSTRSELETRPLADLVADRDRDMIAALPALLEAGAFRDRDVIFLSSTGQNVSLSVNASPQRDAEGALVSMVLVARDDRELKEAQARLQLTDRLATMGTVAAGVAHEINNPLAFVIGNLDFITEELEAAGEASLGRERFEEVMRALKASQSGAERVRHIVRDLKTFSRVDQDALGRADLPKLLDSALNMLRNELRHHATVVRDYGAVPLVEANEARLTQVFLNLIQNAAQAIDKGNAEANEIRVSTGTGANGEAVVEVRDSGSGISEQNLSRIFDAFFTTKPVGVGTGLGLSISHKIVAALGGRIEVESTLGAGSTFRVVLPAVEALAQASEGRPAPAARPGARRRLLVIDDEVEIARFIERTLGRDHDVSAATGGEDGLSRLMQQDYDLVLCDLVMPDVSGMQLYDRLVASHPERARRIVFMSGGAVDTNVRQFLASTTNQFVEKPLDAETLRALLALAEPA